jgi:hypothetical protein
MTMEIIHMFCDVFYGLPMVRKGGPDVPLNSKSYDYKYKNYVKTRTLVCLIFTGVKAETEVLDT